MPRGVYVRTEQYKREMSVIMRGIKYPNRKRPPLFTEEHKKNVSKGLYKVKAGLWNKGKKRSADFKKKNSDTHKRLGTKPPIMRGEKSNLWRGGISTLNSKVRECLKYKNWRSEIFKRDKYACVIGGKEHNNRLQVDHYPKSFSGILKENNIKSLEEALNCEELWEISNGRTLCIDCHKKTDTYLKSYKNR